MKPNLIILFDYENMGSMGLDIKCVVFSMNWPS